MFLTFTQYVPLSTGPLYFSTIYEWCVLRFYWQYHSSAISSLRQNKLLDKICTQILLDCFLIFITLHIVIIINLRLY